MFPSTITATRVALGGVLLLGIGGTLLELVLIGHLEDTEQKIPLWILGSTAALLLLHVVVRSRVLRRLVQLAMILCMASGIWGLTEHYESNLEFKRELEPDLEGWDLVRETLHAKSPPSLAPGALAFIGLLGLVYAGRGLNPEPLPKE